jgi:hypothetical protein
LLLEEKASAQCLHLNCPPEIKTPLEKIEKNGSCHWEEAPMSTEAHQRAGELVNTGTEFERTILDFDCVAELKGGGRNTSPSSCSDKPGHFI